MRYLITAGPTREAIDPVRFISNRSSGTMGYAVARAALAAGHEVTLITGPVCIAPPEDCEVIPVTSAAEMHRAVAAKIGKCDVAVMVAAVSDFRPVKVAERKIKKNADCRQRVLELKLECTEDILGDARGRMGFRGLLVGFAAETDRVEENAREKLHSKGCDLIVANDVSIPDIGFDSADNALILLHANGEREELPRAPKTALATELIQRISTLDPDPGRGASKLKKD